MAYISGWLIEGGGGHPDQGLPSGPPGHVGGGPIVPPAPPVMWPPPAHGEVVPPIALPDPGHPTPPPRPQPGPPDHVGGGPSHPPEYPSGGPIYPGGRPDQGLPPGGGHPGQPLPGGPNYPSGGPVPPGGQTDPGYDRPEGGGGEHPGGGPIKPPEYPSGGPIEPVPPGVIWPPAGGGAQGKYLALVVVAVGSTGQITYAWTVVDPSLTVGWPLPGGPPGHAGQPLPPYAQPK